MRIILVILTISCLLAKDVYQFSWDIWYTIHKKEVAEKLCENKEKPMLKCNGKCYLAKQLKKVEVKETEEQQKNAPVRPKVVNELKIVEYKSFQVAFTKVSNEPKKKANHYFLSSNWKYNYTSTIDHPPIA